MRFIQLHWFYSIPFLKTFMAVVYEIVNRPLQLSPPCRGTHGSTEGKASALVETVGTILALKARKMSKNPLDRRHWNFTTNAILLFAENHCSFFSAPRELLHNRPVDGHPAPTKSMLVDVKPRSNLFPPKETRHQKSLKRNLHWNKFHRALQQSFVDFMRRETERSVAVFLLATG